MTVSFSNANLASGGVVLSPGDTATFTLSRGRKQYVNEVAFLSTAPVQARAIVKGKTGSRRVYTRQFEIDTDGTQTTTDQFPVQVVTGGGSFPVRELVEEQETLSITVRRQSSQTGDAQVGVTVSKAQTAEAAAEAG